MNAICKYFSVSYRMSSPFYNWILLQAIALSVNGIFFYSKLLDADIRLFLIGGIVVFFGIQLMMKLRERKFLQEYPAIPIRCTSQQKYDLMENWNERTDYYRRKVQTHHIENYLFLTAVFVYEAMYLYAVR